MDKLIDDVHRSFRDKYRQELLNGAISLITTNFDFKTTFGQLLK